MNASRLTTATANTAVVVLVGSAVAVAAGDPTPTPPPRIAVVARGDGSNFADALAVGSVAGQLGAPVFTTPAASLNEATADALVDYDPELVIITGGTAAISADVEAAIESATGLPVDKVVRAFGADRYETAGEIAAIFDNLGIDAAFLPVGATATDSDLLDGLDSTAFLGADARATDSDLLDGMDSDVFLTTADQTPFLAEMNGGEQAILATNGSLTLFARCMLNQGGNDTVEIVYTSDVAGWFTDDGGGTAHAADAEVVEGDLGTTTGTAAFGNVIDVGVAVSADGDYLAFDGESLAVSLNVLGTVCRVQGVAIKG